MPLDMTAPGLDALLIATVLEMELSQRDLQVASKRYHLIPEHLQRPSSSMRRYMDSALVYPQGSRAIGATIVHGDSDDRFDLDAVLEFPTPLGWGPGKVLDELHKAFQGFPDVRKIERCTRCIQLQFAFMHLDVTPMNPFPDPRQERAGEIYHSSDVGEETYFRVNPYGFGTWVRKNVTLPSIQFQDHIRNLRSQMMIPDRVLLGTMMSDAEIDELPEPIDPLRDAPQIIALKLMKRYLNLRYAKRDIKRPVSVYLTKTAVMVPLSPYGLCAQLEAFCADLDRRMTVALETGKRPDEVNPAFPEENFNDRWPKDNSDMKVFLSDLRHLSRELARAKGSELAEIRKIFDDLFGERVTDLAVRSYLDRFSGTAGAANYERGKGFLASPALIAPVAPSVAQAARATPQVSKAPAHHFHPGLLRK